MVSHAVQLLKRIRLTTEIRCLGSDEAAIPEQEELDRHDEDVTDLTVRLQALSAAPVTDGRTLALRQLAQLQAKLTAIGDYISTLRTIGVPLPRTTHGIKRELFGIYNNVISITLNDTIKRQEKLIFDMSVIVTRLLYSPTSTEALVLTTPETPTRASIFPKLR